MYAEEMYSAQKALLQPTHTAGTRLAVREDSAIKDSRLGLLHACTAQRCSLRVGASERDKT